MSLLEDFRKIKLFAFDVDGVLTNGQVLLLADGQMARSMNIKDGYALQLAVRKGYHILVVSGGSEEAVSMRLRKLGVNDVKLGVTDKSNELRKYLQTHSLTPEQVLYMGDDIPDLDVMKLAGLPACPADAASEIKAISRYVSPFSGGQGCARDVIEKVLKLNGDWDLHPDVVSR